ncbi:Gfo/Idh/MocA family protein [Tessaracoccus lapidicaptus]|uniref:Gfo/Idh/MocA family protein n=1 Tax=Tessaracoccus lapidicaptus TaxID=1427523 RepID=UPI00333EF1FE
MTGPRFAVVGCGSIAPTHVRALQQLAGRAEVIACADVVPERAERLAAEFGLTAMSMDDVLADPAIDAVSVCVPSGRHAEVGVPALLAGKHVIVEKPMEISLDACDRLLAAQRQSGGALAVVSQHRFDPASQLVHDAVASGRLGEIVLAECRVPWFRTQEYYDSAGWRGTWELDGGGALINQGVHTVDLLRWMCGPATSVFARSRTATHDRIDVEDVVCATVEFAGGAIATVMASTSAYPGFPASLSLHGTGGGAVIRGDRLELLALHDGDHLGGEASTTHAQQVASGGTRAATRAVADAAEPSDPADTWGEAHRRQLLDFVDAIEQGRAPIVDGLGGRQSLELVLAIYASARTGDIVRLPLTS